MAKKHRSGKQATSGDMLRKHPQDRKRKSEGTIRASALIWIGLAVLVVAAAAFLLLRPHPGAPSEITAAQAFEKHQAGAFFLDVRTKAEWDQGHIAKSVPMPLEELPNRLSEVPRDRDVVVVCRSGVRSKEGATILRQAGFTNVSCMSGGLLAWMGAGYPVEQ